MTFHVWVIIYPHLGLSALLLSVLVSLFCVDTDIFFVSDPFSYMKLPYKILEAKRASAVFHHQCRAIESKLYIKIYPVISVFIYY